MITLNDVINIENYDLCDGPINCFGNYVGEWIDCDDVWLNVSEQGTDEWKESRMGRITASDFGAAAGVSRFKTREELLNQKINNTEQKFTSEAIAHMSRGTMNEPVARDFYIKDTKFEIIERGLVVPKWNPLIGASVDGDIINSDGCIEIKCPNYIYGPLREHHDMETSGFNHIYRTHYCQMQGGAAIYDKKWFDYVVFGVEERKMYIERVPFDKNYWDSFLYPKLESFCDELKERCR